MEDEKHTCLECNKVYLSLKNLVAHNRAVHTINVSICDICTNAFKHADALKQHTRIVHESKEVACDQCGKVVKNKAKLWHHVLQVHSKSECCSCHICGSKYKNNYSLQRHVRKCTVKPKKAPTSYGVGKFLGYEDSYCETCDKTFTTKNYLKSHNHNAHAIKQAECKICNKMVKSRTIMANHYKIVHNIFDKKMIREAVGPTLGPGSGRWKTGNLKGARINCVTCGRNYSTSRYYNGHKKNCSVPDEPNLSQGMAQLVHSQRLPNLAKLANDERKKEKKMQTWNKMEDDAKKKDLANKLGLPPSVYNPLTLSEIQCQVQKIENETNIEDKTISLINSAVGANGEQSETLDIFTIENTVRCLNSESPFSIMPIPNKPIAEKLNNQEYMERWSQNIEGKISYDKLNKLSQLADFGNETKESLPQAEKTQDIGTPKNHQTLKDEKVFQCLECPRIYSIQAKLKQHTRYWHIAGHYTCQECEANFTLKGRLKNHVHRHHRQNVETDLRFESVQQEILEKSKILIMPDDLENIEQPKILIKSEDLENIEQPKILIKSEDLENIEQPKIKPEDLEKEFEELEKELQEKYQLPILQNSKSSYILSEALKTVQQAKDSPNPEMQIKQEAKNKEKKVSKIIKKNIYSKENHNTNETEVIVQQAIQQNKENKGQPFIETGKIIKCSKCPRAYSSHGKLKQHVGFWHTVGEYTCNKCAAQFSLKGKLKNHVYEHKDDNNAEIGNLLTCPECSRGYNSPYKLKQHIKYWHEVGEFTCNKCAIPFSLRGRLKNHSQEHKNDANIEKSYRFPCVECTHEYTSPSKLKQHIRFWHTIGDFTCDKCATKFDLRGSLKNHVQAHKNDTNIENGKTFACSNCPREFNSPSKLKQHIKLLHTAGEFNCAKCPASFTLRGRFKNHYQSRHREGVVIPQICTICSESFKTVSIVRKHIKLVHEAIENTINCNKCGKGFRHKALLVSHLKNVHDNVSIVCTQCGKVCKNAKSYVKHSKHNHMVRQGPHPG